MVDHAVSAAERPAAEAALAQAAEQYNRGTCSLEAFVMRMVAVSGREAVIDSLHAVGWASQVQLMPSGFSCLHLRQLRASVLLVQLHLSCSGGHGADLMGLNTLMWRCGSRRMARAVGSRAFGQRRSR